MATAVTIAAGIESVLNALKDFVKFRIVNFTDTGNKTQDNLINVFLLALLQMVFGLFSVTDVLKKYNARKFKIRPGGKTCIDDENYDYYEELLSSSPRAQYSTWYITPTNAAFTERLVRYYFANKPKAGTSKTNPTYFGIRSGAFVRADTKITFDNMSKTIASGSYVPLYVDGDDVLGLHKHSETVMLVYTSSAIMAKFSKTVLEMQEEKLDNDPNEVKNIKMIDVSGEEIGIIYPCRTLEKFVSRHKPDIEEHINSFIHANTHGAGLGGFASYNLGIMLYGIKPGTGKTFLMKAIANRLRRNVMVVDMRKIKTRKDFEHLFMKPSEHIIFLDEFDCVQGAIRNRSDTPDGKESSSDSETVESKQLKVLQDRMLELMKIMRNNNVAPTTGAKPSGPDPLQQEYESIKTKIDNIENSLSLDTFLTVLDGGAEMRNRVIIATTNYIDRIDPALIRGGRFDLVVELGKFNQTETREFLSLMFKDTITQEEQELLQNTELKDDVYTPVELIGIATRNKTFRRVLEIIRV